MNFLEAGKMVVNAVDGNEIVDALGDIVGQDTKDKREEDNENNENHFNDNQGGKEIDAEKLDNWLKREKSVKYYHHKDIDFSWFTVKYNMGAKHISVEFDHFLRRYSALLNKVPGDSNMNQKDHL